MGRWILGIMPPDLAMALSKRSEKSSGLKLAVTINFGLSNANASAAARILTGNGKPWSR
jgi:hypothetical protein